MTIHMREGEVISEELLVNRFKKVVLEKIKLKNGEVLDWIYMDTPKSIVVIALTPEKEVVMVNVYRHNLRQNVTELPGGTGEEGEPDDQGAHRELLEETGYQTDNIISLGSYYVLPTETNRKVHYFLALNVQKTQEPELDDIIEKYWEMSIKLVPFNELLTAASAATYGVGGVEALFGLRLANDYLQAH